VMHSAFSYIGVLLVQTFAVWNESSFGDRTTSSRGSMFRVRQNRSCRSPSKLCEACDVLVSLFNCLLQTHSGELQMVRQHKFTFGVLAIGRGGKNADRWCWD